MKPDDYDDRDDERDELDFTHDDIKARDEADEAEYRRGGI